MIARSHVLKIKTGIKPSKYVYFDDERSACTRSRSASELYGSAKTPESMVSTDLVGGVTGKNRRHVLLPLK